MSIMSLVGFNSRRWHVSPHQLEGHIGVIVMTAQELAKVAEKVRKDREHDYAPEQGHYDRYGNDLDHGERFDSRHVEDVFPY